MNKLWAVLLFFLCATILCRAEGQVGALFRQPTVSRTHIVFSYAGDLWIVSREGGEARRLTTVPGEKWNPIFSPDGTQVAFTRESGDDGDVFVVPANGGDARRLTYHPAGEWHGAVGWTPDGKSVVGFNDERLFTVPSEGGRVVELPLPSASDGSFSPDGGRVAYIPFSHRQSGVDVFRGYRGGATSRIWIAHLPDCRIEKIPRDNSYDFSPMWVDKQVYFLSDRDGPISLFAYNVTTKKVAKVIRDPESDIWSASAGPAAIVYATLRSLHLYDIETRKSHRLAIRVSGGMPEKEPRSVNALDQVTGMRLSPTGDRVLIEARGELLTLPVGQGRPQNLTNTPGAFERFPAWSPDGKRIAYFSDESGEYALHIRNADGTGAVKKIDPGQPPGFYFPTVWSPDSSKIAYWDHRLSLWYVDVENGTPVRIDRDLFACEEVRSRIEAPPPTWSPDNRWVAYTKVLKSNLRALYIYSLQTGQSRQVTDGMSDIRSPQFDRSGKYLYFAASTDIGPTLGGELSTWFRRSTSSIYVAFLRKTEKLPGAEEHGATDAVTIDVAGFEDRVVALPVPARNYAQLVAGKPGVLFLLETVPESKPGRPIGPSNRQNLFRLELAAKKADKVVEDIRDFDLSFDGERMLYQQGQKWMVSPAAVPPTPSEEVLKLESLQVRVDPAAEWKQMFREVWRTARDFFYDPGHHGVDWNAQKERFEPYLDSVASPGDLNHLLWLMLYELPASHTGAGVRTGRETESTGAGVLGADYEVVDGRYRIARIYAGDKWNPQVRSPLAQPGLDIRQGDYVLAVDGQEVRASDNISRFFMGKAEKEVVLRIGANATGSQARDVIVIPASEEWQLREFAWADENRRKVDRLTGGRVAYVYLHNTGAAGLAAFDRYFFAQAEKEAVIIDERFNRGGTLADYFISRLGQPVLALGAPREGRDGTVPFGVIRGPKVMITNEAAGSGGDALAYFFRQAGLGPLIGTRTAGALLGSGGASFTLMGGGWVGAAYFGVYGPEGRWLAENEGVAPDVEVEQDPAAVRAGHDPQLEKAIEVVLTLLKKNPPRAIQRPPYKRLQ